MDFSFGLQMSSACSHPCSNVPALHLAIRYLRATSTNGCVSHAEYGNLEALQVLLQELNTVRQSEDWKRCCCAFAARGGHVNVLEWLRSFDSSYAFDWVVCLFAAQHRHLDTLKWLRAQSPPCPWRPVEVLKFAQQFQRTRVVDWVTQQTTLAMHSHGVEASGGLPLMQNEH